MPLPPAQTATGAPDERAIARNRPLYLRTFRSILTAHTRAPERKSLNSNGTTCTARTEGQLRPSPTIARTTVPIGRETNYTDEAGLTRDPGYTSYPDPTHDNTRDPALTILRRQAREPGGRTELAAALELSDTGLRRFLTSGRCRPKTRQRAWEVAIRCAHTYLRDQRPHQHLPTDPETLLQLAIHEGCQARPRCEGCGAELHGRQRLWCAGCRTNGWRRRELRLSQSST
jgi:hypothetical protein